jgi:hypothetical protein
MEEFWKTGRQNADKIRVVDIKNASRTGWFGVNMN